MTMDINRLEMH